MYLLLYNRRRGSNGIKGINIKIVYCYCLASNLTNCVLHLLVELDLDYTVLYSKKTVNSLLKSV